MCIGLHRLSQFSIQLEAGSILRLFRYFMVNLPWGLFQGCLIPAMCKTTFFILNFSSEACWSIMNKSLSSFTKIKPRLNWPKTSIRLNISLLIFFVSSRCCFHSVSNYFWHLSLFFGVTKNQYCFARCVTWKLSLAWPGTIFVQHSIVMLQ